MKMFCQITFMYVSAKTLQFNVKLRYNTYTENDQHVKHRTSWCEQRTSGIDCQFCPFIVAESGNFLNIFPQYSVIIIFLTANNLMILKLV